MWHIICWGGGGGGGARNSSDAFSWHLDGVKFKNIPVLSPWTLSGLTAHPQTPYRPRPLRGLEGNENSIFNKEAALQFFPGKKTLIWILNIFKSPLQKLCPWMAQLSKHCQEVELLQMRNFGNCGLHIKHRAFKTGLEGTDRNMILWPDMQIISPTGSDVLLFSSVTSYTNTQ